MVHVRPRGDYPGAPKLTGELHITVSRIADDRIGNTFQYEFHDVDMRCTVDGHPEPGGCVFAVHEGTNCSAPGADLVDPSALRGKWNQTRFNVAPQGTAQGTVEVISDLSEVDLYRQVVVVTDFDGHFVACGLIESACMKVFGVCFYVFARISCCFATVFAVLSSFWLMHKHFKYNKNQVLWRHTARILLMVPIYSVQAFVSLCLKVDPGTAEVLKFFREFYEAIVILSFLEYILICVGGAESVLERYDGGGTREPRMSASKSLAAVLPDVPSQDFEAPPPLGTPLQDNEEDGAKDERRKKLRHICPWSWLCPPWGSARTMLRVCTLGTLSYVVVGLVVPPTALILHHVMDPFSEEYDQFIRIGKMCFMISSMLAINSLFEMANIFIGELHNMAPLSKFLSVKMVIFFTFWQGIVLSWLEKAGVFQKYLDVGHSWNSGEQISQGIQHGLICWEMFAASIVHHWAFPPSDYKVLKRMANQRTASLESSAASGDADLTAAVRRGFQVVNFTDILMIARRGFARTRYQEKGEAVDSSTESSSEAPSSLSSSEEEEETDEDGEERHELSPGPGVE